MPSKTFRQARLMAAAAHDPVFARRAGIPQGVAKEFNQADAKDGFLSAAERARGKGTPKLAKGGRVDGVAIKGKTRGRVT